MIIELRQKKAKLLDEAEALLNKEDRSQEDMDKAKSLTDEAKGVQAEIEMRESIGESREVIPPVLPPENVRVEVKEPEKRFATFGEQLRAVMDACRPGGFVDPRLIEERSVSGMSEGVPSDGGFLVQTDFSTAILQKAHDVGKLWPRCFNIPVSANSDGVKLPAVDESNRANGSRFGGIQMYWVDEGDQGTTKKVKFRQVELKLHRLMGLAHMTNDLLRDSSAAEAFLMRAFSEEVAFVLDDMVVRGTGSGQPLGVLNAPALVTVTKETNQAASTILTANVIKMYSRCYGRENAVWFYNSEIEPQLFTMSIAVGTGGVPVYMPANGLSTAPYGTLFGRPAIPIEQATGLTSVGDIMLLNLGEYLTATKGGIETASSIHLRFDYDEMAFRIIYRADGQPAWSSVLTPYKGSATISPFVTLGAR